MRMVRGCGSFQRFSFSKVCLVIISAFDESIFHPKGVISYLEDGPNHCEMLPQFSKPYTELLVLPGFF
jgi:hypothetical protein